MSSRIDGVTTKVIEAWIRRDFGLSSAQLRVVLELKLGVQPEWDGTLSGGAAHTRYVTLAQASLAEMAKPRCAERVKDNASLYARYLFPKKISDALKSVMK